MINLNIIVFLLFIFFMISMNKIMSLSRQVRKIERTLNHLMKKRKLKRNKLSYCILTSFEFKKFYLLYNFNIITKLKRAKRAEL